MAAQTKEIVGISRTALRPLLE